MSLRSYLLDATVDSIQASLLRHMPFSHQQEYYLWGISSDNPQRDVFLQMMGINQVVNLTASLLDGLVEPHLWQKLGPYAGYLNAYFMYEVVSDDLGIGLAPFAVGDRGFPLRREILYAFNYVMAERLKGEPTPAEQMLEPLEHFITSVSSFKQSLSAEKRQSVLKAYQQRYRGVTPFYIEYALWPVLVANVEICTELTDGMDDLQVGHLLRQGFINRYEGMTRLLEGEPMSHDTLLDVGTWTILVAPTLTYYVGVLNEILYPNPQFHCVMEDGLLAEAIYTASMLLRLLNDLGGLVLVSPEQRAEVLYLLYETYQQNKHDHLSFNELLLNFASQWDIMARIHKDLVHGEFNIALNNLAGETYVPNAMLCFADNLTYFADIYAEKSQTLKRLLDTLTDRLEDDKASLVIARFVEFHQKVYAHSFTTVIGEYSI